MAADAALCTLCGKPLDGRARFEGTCAACREAEVLARTLPLPEALEGGEPDDGSSPVSRRGLRLALCVLVPVAVAAVAVVAVWPRTSAPPPPARATAPSSSAPVAPAKADAAAAPKAVPRDVADAVRQETRELLGLIARGSYGRAIDNYVQPDEVDFARLERVLDDIVRGSAAQGFAAWTARLVRVREGRLTEELRQAGEPDPRFAVAILAYLAREPAASDAGRRAEDRARAVLGWHLGSLFDGLDVAGAAPGAVTEPLPGQFEVALDCRGSRRAAWLHDEPLAIRWTSLPVGWVVRLGLADRVERARDLLKRPAVARPAAGD